MPQRLDWLDIAKGITILLMVLAHSSIPSWLHYYIWVFHMPLFFIASGYCSNWYKNDLATFIKNKSKSLLIPFVVYSIINIIIQSHYGFTTFYNVLLKGWQGYALWFIPVLYIATIVARCVYSIENKSVRYFIMIVLLGLAELLCFYKVPNHWTMTSVPYASFLICIGSEIRTLNHKMEAYTILRFVIYTVLAFVVSTLVDFDMSTNRVIPIAPMLIGAISGTMSIFLFSFCLAKNTKWISKVFIIIGKETMLFVAFSQVVIMVLNCQFSLNPLFKYSLLAISLILIKYLKDLVNRLLKIKLL